jgi:hypothetical protein
MFGFSIFEKKRSIALKQFEIDHPELRLYFDKEPRTTNNKTNTQWVFFLALDKSIPLESSDNCDKLTCFIYEVDLKNRLAQKIFQDKNFELTANKFHELHKNLKGIF